MKARHLVTLPLTAVALSTLASCGIPPTGVVEAGGPASGIVPVTPVYFVRGDTLVAVPRPTGSPGDVAAAVDLLLLGPTPNERSDSLTSAFFAAPTFAPPPPTPPATDAPTPDAPTTDAAPEAASDRPIVQVELNTITIEMPYPVGKLGEPARWQLICTAAAAHRIGSWHADEVTVRLIDGIGPQITETDSGCPDW
ncbi:hypothetical protein ACIQAC_32750 [Streptomyces sp. NPDC088387]|uniref:hypothetical protein n=1 Tax=Streptomyces sp. NPDC088387 TaxID=3365859 RepID=UPI0037F3687F